MLPGPLESDKKLAKAAPIFLSMLKSETREETADAVIKAATAALGAHFITQFNCSIFLTLVGYCSHCFYTSRLDGQQTEQIFRKRL